MLKNGHYYTYIYSLEDECPDRSEINLNSVTLRHMVPDVVCLFLLVSLTI